MYAAPLCTTETFPVPQSLQPASIMTPVLSLALTGRRPYASEDTNVPIVTEVSVKRQSNQSLSSEKKVRSCSVFWDISVFTAYFVVNAAPEVLFAECPDAYTHYCFHGTCRFIISERTASCICSKGYIGYRCQKMDLLQVMASDPRSILVVALVAVLTLIGSICFSIYLCRRKEQSKLGLLRSTGVPDV